MALTIYYMLCRVSDDVILEYRLTDDFGVENYPNEMVVRSATFSTVVEDSPDVLLANPDNGGTFVEPATYTAPPTAAVDPYLKVQDWSGDGAPDSEDGVWELTDPDGIQNFTLTVKKWDRTTDTAIQESGDRFELSVFGAACPCGRLELDVNGEANIIFTPASGYFGGATVNLSPINTSAQYRSEAGKFRVVSS
jgi:hypothetical protein